MWKLIFPLSGPRQVPHHLLHLPGVRRRPDRHHPRRRLARQRPPALVSHLYIDDGHDWVSQK